eukprot:767491-Hanusia_phi.AAC.5
MTFNCNRCIATSFWMFLLLGIFTFSCLPFSHADVPPSREAQSNVDHSGLAKSDNTEFDSLVDEKKLMEGQKLPSHPEAQEQKAKQANQGNAAQDVPSGIPEKGDPYASREEQVPDNVANLAPGIEEPHKEASAKESSSWPDAATPVKETLDQGQRARSPQTGESSHHDSKQANVADQKSMQGEKEQVTTHGAQTASSHTHSSKHGQAPGDDQQNVNPGSERIRAAEPKSEPIKPKNDHAGRGETSASPDVRGRMELFSHPSGQKTGQSSATPIGGPHRSAATQEQNHAGQSKPNAADKENKDTKSQEAVDTAKSAADRQVKVGQDGSQGPKDFQSDANKQMPASAGTAASKPQASSAPTKNDPISMLITDIAPHKRRSDSGAEDGANDVGVVNVESAREREINELLRRAEKYRFGMDATKINYAKALEAYSAAAKLGSHAATALLGEMYKHGLGVEPDLQKAISHFNASAEHVREFMSFVYVMSSKWRWQGDPVAQRNLAMLYASGIGLEENQAFFAVGCFILAMGYRHMHGVGVPKNCQTAVEYYLPAVEAVVRDVQQFRPPPMMERYPLAQDAGGKSRAVDLDEDVVNYYQYSAARGDAAAQVALGQLYYFGARGIEQNYAEALRWYELAAEQGDANALGHIGNMYVQGIHVEANNETALKYFRQGAEKGNGIAINGLGYMNLYGMGLPQSSSEAVKLFSNAAEQGNLEARFNLGALYVVGRACQGLKRWWARSEQRLCKGSLLFLAGSQQRSYAGIVQFGNDALEWIWDAAVMPECGSGDRPYLYGLLRSACLQFLKSVAERGSWGLRIQNGYKIDASFLLYSEASEMGYEVAQANVAFLYDLVSHVRPFAGDLLPQRLDTETLQEETRLTSGRRSKALNAFELSAQQGNSAAELKIGDYYYFGMGTAVNFRKAVAHYRAASEARNAQAMFNLAYMHEHGIGLPKASAQGGGRLMRVSHVHGRICILRNGSMTWQWKPHR